MLRATLTVLTALVLTFAATTVRADDAGTVVSLEGTVEIGRGGAFAAAIVGSPVQSGDTIRTGNPGRARILFADDSVLNLGDDTTLVIDETVFDASKGAASTLIRLLGGKVRALVSDYYSGGQGTYRIETATAVSGVRGTEFVMSHDASTAFSEVLGLGGTVEVHGTIDRKNRGVLVHANEITEIAKGKYPTTPRQITTDDERYQRLMAGLDLPGGGLPETLLLEDPAFGGKQVPLPDTADGNVFETPTGGTNGTTGTSGSEPLADLPPDAPGHTGGDLLGQPQPVLEAPTDVDVRF
ncbi:MAG: FecR domain-containing protein [Candidatus Binatia bacterium]